MAGLTESPENVVIHFHTIMKLSPQITRNPLPERRMGRRAFCGIALGGLAGATTFAWKQVADPKPGGITLVAEPTGIMGTRARLLATAPNTAIAREALQAAEAELRRIEGLMSTYLDHSEISRLNAAPAGTRIPLSEDTLRVLHAARRIHDASSQALDITARPLKQLWDAATRNGHPPADTAIRHARANSCWPLLELEPGGAVKRHSETAVDLGGIAKGYGVDRAMEAIRSSGASGGLVEVGGDVRCFGTPSGRSYWSIAIRDPYSDGILKTLKVTDAALCTSGDYARGYELGGIRLSHIINPADGRPLENSRSITVRGPSALEADAWATAASVLGTRAGQFLPSGFGLTRVG